MKNFIVLLVGLVLMSCSLFEDEEKGGISDKYDLYDMGLIPCTNACKDLVYGIAMAERRCTGYIGDCNPSADPFCIDDLEDEICNSHCHGQDEEINYAVDENADAGCYRALDEADCSQEIYTSPWDNDDCREVFESLHLDLEQLY